jgi:hypothetical protein
MDLTELGFLVVAGEVCSQTVNSDDVSVISDDNGWVDGDRNDETSPGVWLAMSISSSSGVETRPKLSLRCCSLVDALRRRSAAE